MSAGAARTGLGAPPAAKQISRVLRVLRRRYHHTRFAEANGPDPFRILIGCLLSLRTRDEVSYPATERLFQRASTPETMRRLRTATVEKLIYPVGFYRTKARTLRRICALLVDRHEGRVPDHLEGLLALPGVGRKTANLVLTLGFGKPGICVDTHVHRISNRLGWVRTRTPEQTEFALRETLPRRHWIEINEILVRHGQQVCKPLSPICSSCPVDAWCPKVGLGRRR